MTREEQIKKEAKNKYPYIKGLPQTVAHQEIFIEAAQWADKTMIERVCEWLENECDINDYLGGIFSGPCSISFDWEKLSKTIHKAMEE